MRVSRFSIINSLVQIAIGFYFVRLPESTVYLTLVPILLGLIVLPMQQSIQHKVVSAVRFLAFLCMLSAGIYTYGIWELLQVSDFAEVKYMSVLLVINMMTLFAAAFTLMRARKKAK